jgi:hypothetical protein
VGASLVTAATRARHRHNQTVERDLKEARARSLVIGLSVGPAVRAIHKRHEGMAMTTMTHPPERAVRVFGGVDTHKDVHVAAALDELGRLLGTGSFSTTMEGYRRLWRWLRSWGEVVAVGVEGTGSWGAGWPVTSPLRVSTCAR